MKQSRLIRIIVCALLFTAFNTSTYAQAPAPANDALAKGILWEVKSETNSVYLFGSVHIAKADFYPLPDAVESAYSQSNLLMIEADATDTDAVQKAMPLFTYAPPDKLEKHLSKQTWNLIKSTAGPAAEQLQSVRPVMLATVMTMGAFAQLGYDPKQGIDLHFIQQAKNDQKRIVELEGMEFQAKVLGSIADKEGDIMLRQTIQGLRNGQLIKETEALIAAWKAGDAEQTAKQLQSMNKDPASKKIYKLLFDDRNIGMASKARAAMDAGDKVFVVVGAGHLVGKGSVIDLLKKQGLQVRQIN